MGMRHRWQKMTVLQIFSGRLKMSPGSPRCAGDEFVLRKKISFQKFRIKQSKTHFLSAINDRGVIALFCLIFN